MNSRQSVYDLQKRIKELEQALSEARVQTSNNDYHRVLFDNLQYEVHVWKLVYDNAGRIKTWYLTDANKKALESIDYPQEHIFGKHTDNIFDRDVSKYFSTSVNIIFATNAPHSWDYYRLKTGQHLRITTFPCGHYFISYCVDITKTKKAEAVLKDTVLQLKEAISAGNIGLWDWDLISNTTYFSPEWKKQLGYAPHEIAHDFNNLLTPVLGYTQLIRTVLPDQHASMGYLENIESSAERAKDLSQQILLMSRKSIKHILPVNIEVIAQEVISTVMAHSPDNIEVDTHIEEELPTLGAEPAQIHRRMLNLCNNAIQAMPQGGKLTINISSCYTKVKALGDKSDEDYICLKIKDSGNGIDTSAINRIFEPFFTTKLYGTQRGTGLGLAIVDSAVKQHEGHIEVTSEIGKGTEFTVYLPVIAGHFLEREETHPPSSYLDGCNIILIDDELAICELGEALLSSLGCNVITFQHVHKCIEFLELHSQRYDLLISDYALPEMNGDQLISTIREKGISIPCIIATGFTHLATESNCKQWQCAAIVSKPFTIEALSSAITRAIN